MNRYPKLPLVLTLLVSLTALGSDLSRAEAEKRALQEVPGGKILSVEREVEKGKDVWSLDVRSADGKHVFELQYEAVTGKLVSREEESPNKQKEEAAQDAKKAQLSTAANFAVTKRFPIGGDGGWDYLIVDPSSKRLFVSRGSHVIAVDTDSGKVAGEIAGTDGVHGIALAPGLGRGFTSNGRSSTVSVFNLATLEVTSTVKTTGENPDAILFDPSSKRVFVFNGRGQNATVIDGSSLAVVGTIPLGGKPEFAAADGRGRVFVNIEDKNEIAALDADRLTVAARWPLASCNEPAGLTIDRKNQRLFAGCHNRLLVALSSVDGSIVSKVPIGEGNDAVGFDEESGLVFASNSDGTLNVVKETAPGAYTVAQTVETQKGARTHAVDSKSHRVFVPAAKYGPPPSPTTEHPNPRPQMIPGSFELLVVAPIQK
jgi:DNA-binding beta-propeller fold protein YncE